MLDRRTERPDMRHTPATDNPPFSLKPVTKGFETSGRDRAAKGDSAVANIE